MYHRFPFSPFKHSLDILTNFLPQKLLILKGTPSSVRVQTAYGTESTCALFRQRRPVSGTTELGSKSSSSRIWSSATLLRIEVFLSLLACNLNLHGSKPTARRLSPCLFISHLHLGLFSEVHRSQQHNTLTTDTRNRKGFIVQIVASNSLAEGSQHM